jgi:hypothetical protein
MNDTERELDAKALDQFIAEEVMGWYEYATKIDGKHTVVYEDESGEMTLRRADWSPSTNPADDRLIQDKVQADWSVDDQFKFAEAVWSQANDRYEQPYPFKYINEESIMLTMAMGYRVGDYARAAFNALEG